MNIFNLEILIAVLIFVFSFLLIWKNFKLSLYLLLLSSVFLHKELFSLYKWDLLPVRFIILAYFFTGIIYVIKWLVPNLSNKKQLYKDAKTFLLEPINGTIILIWLSRAISILFSKSFMDSFELFGFFSAITVFGLLFYSKYKKSSQEILDFLRFYVVLGFGLSIFGFLQLFLYYKFDIVTGAFWSIPNNLPRVGSLFWDVNHFGLFLTSALVLCGAFLLGSTTWKSRLVYAVALLPMTGILFMTNSRTAWMAAGVALLVFAIVLFTRKFGLKGIITILSVLLLISIPAVLEYSNKASPFRAKIRSYFNYRLDSFDSHFLLLTGTAQIFEKYPVFGGGYGSFFEHFKNTKVSSEYFSRDPAGLTQKVPAHTVWGEIASETGLVGLSIFVAFWILMILGLLYIAFTSSSTLNTLLAAGMSSFLCGVTVAGVFYSYNSEFFWILIFMFLAYTSSQLGGTYSFEKFITYFKNYRSLGLIFVSVLAGFLIFWNLGFTHLIPWDEAIYAKIAKNIAENGEYISLTWKQGLNWFEKPPLGMWFMSFSMIIFGFESFGARFPTAVMGFMTVILTYLISKKFYGKTAALISSLALLTSVHFLYYARTSMLDVQVGFFITLSLYFYLRAKDNVRNASYLNLWFIFAGFSTGAAVMTKGVVGIIPLLIIFANEAYLWFFGFQSFSKKNVTQLFWYFISILIIAAPWHFAVYAKYGAAFIDSYLLYHVVDRALTSIEDKGRPVWWYLEVLKVSMRIWFVVLVGALPLTIFGALKRKKENIFLLIWACVILGIFSASTSKLIWYISPIYPALSIMCGYFVSRSLSYISGRFGFMRSGVMRFIAVYLIFVFALFYLFLNRDMVFTSDLTGAKAYVLAEKSAKFGPDQTVYVDTIEEPLTLFYAGEPYTGVTFKDLKDIIGRKDSATALLFITKESRFLQIQAQYPAVELVAQKDEWVLGKAIKVSPVVVTSK